MQSKSLLSTCVRVIGTYCHIGWSSQYSACQWWGELMATIFLDRIDAAPIANSQFDAQFLQWLWVLVDALNGNMTDIQNSFNLLTAIGYTQTQIIDMQTAGQLSNGVLLYDTTNNEYVGRQSGSLVKFTTTAYP